MTNFEKHKKKILDVMTDPKNKGWYPAIMDGKPQCCNAICEVCELADLENHYDVEFLLWALKEE